MARPRGPVQKTPVSFKVTPQEKQRLLAAALHFQGVEPEQVNLSDFLYTAVLGTLQEYEIAVAPDGDAATGQEMLRAEMNEKEVEAKKRELEALLSSQPDENEAADVSTLPVVRIGASGRTR